MKNGSLFFKNLRRDWFSVLVLVILSFYICTTGFLIVRGIDQITYLTRIFSAAGLGNKVIYGDQENDEGGIIRQAELIEAVPGVAKTEVLKRCTLATEELLERRIFLSKADMFTVYIYDMSALRNLKFSLSEGEYPDVLEPNKLFLPTNFKANFKVGDKVQMAVYNDKNVFTDEHPLVTIQIAGFLEDQCILSDTSSEPHLSLGGLFSSDPDVGILYGLVDDNGQPVEVDSAGIIIVTPDEGVDLKRLDEDLVKIVRSKSHVHTGPELVSRYWESNDSIVRDLFITMVSGFFIAFAVLIAGTYLSLISRQKEMAVWYMSGASWKDCVRMVLAPKLVAVLVGFIAAMLQLFLQDGSEYTYEIYVHFRWSYVLITLGIVLFMFIAGALPFYLATIRKSPVDLFRKD